MDAIVAAITAVPEVTLLDREADADHNRSVLTFVGPPAAVAACPESLTGRYLAGTAGPTAAETPDAGTEGPEPPMEIGRASCRERVSIDV